MLRKIGLFLIVTWVMIGSAQAAPQPSTSLLQDDVESGTGVWTATGLWHRVDSGPCQNAHSGVASWYYGGNSSCNYDTGTTNSGTLTSNSLVIPALPPGSTAAVSFWYYYQTESTGTTYDQRVVQISVDGGAFTNLVQLSGDTMNVWHQEVLDLSSYIGHTIQLRFSFDTIDGILNNYKGWYIDDINVSYGTSNLSYNDSSATYSWVDIAAPGNDTGLTGDDNGQVIPLGFNFPFYANTYSTVGVSTNGFLTFGSVPYYFFNEALPTSYSKPLTMIAPFWDDLYVYSGTGHIYAKTLGSAPNRTFVLEFSNLDYCCSIGSGNLTFEVILSEKDGSITFQYNNMVSVNAGRGSGNSATIGVMNASGTAVTQYSYNTAGSVSDGQAIKFTSVQTDTDGDGLPDWWEIKYGTNPNDPNDPVITDDVDHDGLNWLQEYQNHTDPYDPDTDHDGVSDGQEVANGTNPLVNNGPTTLATFAGPGTDFGTAYYKFTTPVLDPATSGFRVYYGGKSGSTIGDYPAHLDINNLTTTSGYIDQKWGMQGQPQVFFRIAPFKVIGGRKYVGTPSNELSTYFSGAKSSSHPSSDPPVVAKSGGGGTLSETEIVILLGLTLLARRRLRRGRVTADAA